MSFKPIPDESILSALFTKRKIRKSGEGNLLQNTLKLLAQFEENGDEMLVGEMGDLVDALHRSALCVQSTKQKVLIEKLRKGSRKRVDFRK
jgi:arginine/ornithine N-succinyltransferase beta subunit